MDSILNLFDVHKGIELINNVPWFYVLSIAFLLTFIENLFPPSPSDVLLMFTGGLIATGKVGIVELLIASTIGSTLGFLIMYYIGLKFGKVVIDSNRFSFINQKTLAKPEEWFRKYGYYIIIANRFLSGTRAVISFFAGVSGLPILKTTILCTVSAALWNFILLIIGYLVGGNLDTINHYISLYGKIIFPAMAALIIILVTGTYIRKRMLK